MTLKEARKQFHDLDVLINKASKDLKERNHEGYKKKYHQVVGFCKALDAMNLYDDYNEYDILLEIMREEKV